MRHFFLNFFQNFIHLSFLLLPLFCFAEGPKKIEMLLSEKQISLFDDLVVQITIDVPENYSVKEEELKNNLIHSFTSPSTPFQLIDSAREKNTWTFTLRPQYEGSFPITFWNINFFPENATDLKNSIVSPIEYVLVKTPPHTIYIPSLMNSLKLYSNHIPLEMSLDNIDLIKNNQEKEFEQNLFHYKNSQFPLLEIFLLILVFLFLYLSY